MSEFESLFSRHPIPTWVYSVQSLRFLAVNEAAVTAYGYSREQFLAMTIEDIRPKSDVPRLHKHINRDSHSRDMPSFWRHVRVDGSIIDVEVSSSAVEFGGQAARLVAARDVTGRWNDLERLNLALNAGKFAVWEYNCLDGSICWDPINSGAYGMDRSLFPKTQAEFIEMVEPEFRESLQQSLDKCVAEGDRYDCEFKLNMPNLGMRWRHAIGKRILDASGTPLKIIGVGIDITDRKALEEQAHRSQRLEAVGRLAGGIAHDFNNLLTVISGYSHLIKTESSVASTKEAAGEICVAAQRAARLVKQLLDFSRAAPIDPRPIVINKPIEETVVMLRRLIPESIEIRSDVPSAPLVVSVDPGQIEQLVMNLCLNARDAMSDVGRITLVLEKAGDCAQVTISDSGSGMSPEVQKRMFEPFFSTKEVGTGYGLGLSIVHSIVRQLNGTIEVTSALGQGSTFVIKLPLVDPTAL